MKAFLDDAPKMYEMTKLGSLRLSSVILLLFILNAMESVQAQGLSTRVGLSTELIINPFVEEITERNAGVGLRGRVGFGLNDDLSLGLGVGVVSFIFEGANNAEYIFNPQASLIVSLPGETRFPYILGGVGGIFRTGGDLGSRSFMSLHVGYGMAFPLSQSTFFMEIDPVLIIMSESSNVLVPLRIGIIF